MKRVGKRREEGGRKEKKGISFGRCVCVCLLPDPFLLAFCEERMGERVTIIHSEAKRGTAMSRTDRAPSDTYSEYINAIKLFAACAVVVWVSHVYYGTHNVPNGHIAMYRQGSSTGSLIPGKFADGRRGTRSCGWGLGFINGWAYETVEFVQINRQIDPIPNVECTSKDHENLTWNSPIIVENTLSYNHEGWLEQQRKKIITSYSIEWNVTQKNMDEKFQTNKTTVTDQQNMRMEFEKNHRHSLHMALHAFNKKWRVFELQKNITPEWKLQRTKEFAQQVIMDYGTNYDRTIIETVVQPTVSEFCTTETYLDIWIHKFKDLDTKLLEEIQKTIDDRDLKHIIEVHRVTVPSPNPRSAIVEEHEREAFVIREQATELQRKKKQRTISETKAMEEVIAEIGKYNVSNITMQTRIEEERAKTTIDQIQLDREINRTNTTARAEINRMLRMGETNAEVINMISKAEAVSVRDMRQIGFANDTGSYLVYHKDERYFAANHSRVVYSYGDSAEWIPKNQVIMQTPSAASSSGERTGSSDHHHDATSTSTNGG